MTKQAGIQKAIFAYGLWKARLRGAVAIGKSDLTPAQAADDTACEFGRWLYALPPADRADPHFATVEKLHTRFHQEAASVLGLVEAGEITRASSALESGSAFDLAGKQLTLSLIDWSKAA
jgi:hypothetical protein